MPVVHFYTKHCDRVLAVSVPYFTVVRQSALHPCVVLFVKPVLQQQLHSR